MLDKVQDEVNEWLLWKYPEDYNPDSQLKKLFEEVGELAKSLNHTSTAQEKAGEIADCIITLLGVSNVLNISAEQWVTHKWNVVKDRTGYTEHLQSQYEQRSIFQELEE